MFTSPIGSANLPIILPFYACFRRSKFLSHLYYLFFFLSIFIQSNTSSQWIQQYSGTNAGLTRTKFINLTTGWICGNGGTILKTTNSGINWIIQTSGVINNLIDIYPVDSEYVYSVGMFETILKSTNGGNNWQVLHTREPGKYFLGIYFINRNTGWICGSGRWLYRTTNACATFDSSYISDDYSWAWDVYFKDQNTGLLADEAGGILRTTNSGINWTLIYMHGENSEFFELSFIGDTGWVAGWQNRKVYKTTNFGLTWDSLSRVTPEPDVWNASSLFFSSVNIGWVCGGSANVYKTTNGGYNWYKQSIPVFTAYGTIFFINDTIGWCAGSSGTVLNTVYGGLIVSSSMDKRVINETIIEIYIKKEDKYTLEVFNILGEVVDIITDKYLKPGNYKFKYRAERLSSGIYYYKIRSDKFSETKKFVLIK